jgi:hypothetical protein
MRTTLILEDELVERARELTGIRRISDLVRGGLAALIEKESRRRLAEYGGSDPRASAGPRRRENPAVRGYEAAEK